MPALAASHDALLPRQDSRLGLGAALALLAHGGLVAALALSLNWRLPTADAVVSAELWSAVPQVAIWLPALALVAPVTLKYMTRPSSTAPFSRMPPQLLKPRPQRRPRRLLQFQRASRRG
jgi:colicin import membrane protein